MLIGYAIAFIVVAVILVASYRALGGSVATEEQVTDFVGNVMEWVRADVARLAFLASDDLVTNEDEEVARDVRKRLAGYQQQLSRLLPTEDERSDISLSIEAAGWACRMVESGSYRLNRGVRDATRDLYRYARELLNAGATEKLDGVSDAVAELPVRRPTQR